MEENNYFDEIMERIRTRLKPVNDFLKQFGCEVPAGHEGAGYLHAGGWFVYWKHSDEYTIIYSGHRMTNDTVDVLFDDPEKTKELASNHSKPDRFDAYYAELAEAHKFSQALTVESIQNSLRYM